MNRMVVRRNSFGPSNSLCWFQSVYNYNAVDVLLILSSYNFYGQNQINKPKRITFNVR